ncbi:MAG: hypothetical protein ACM3OC_05685 [Deltaproteobacteria bacterium]
MKNFLIIVVSAIVAVFPAWDQGRCEQLIQEPVAMQISSTVSDGSYSIPDIIAACRKSGVKIIILGERDLMRWEYGLWPLRNLLKRRVEEGSLLSFGVGRYLDTVRELQAANTDMLIIPGVESAPYYYWSGRPLDGTLKINDWHRHILAAGFPQAKDYENIPVAGNRKGLAASPGPLSLAPYLGILLGLLIACRRTSFKIRGAGAAAAFFCILIAVNNFPFSQKYDQYSGDIGILPYKNYIAYASQHGAVTFWTHPEAVNVERDQNVAIETKEYADILSRIDGYTGFFVFYEGYQKVGVPHGIWDTILTDYCKGRRRSPVWAAGGLAVDKEGLERNLKDLRTVVLLNRVDRDEVIGSLREGRMYVSRGKDAPGFMLDEFTLSDNGRQAGMGEELKGSSRPTVRVAGHILDGQERSFQIKLIRLGGETLFFDVQGPSFSITYRDEKAAEGKGYYRAEIDTSALQVVTNPVFFGGSL